MKRFGLGLLGMALGVSAAAWGQGASPDAPLMTLSLKTNVVAVPAVVVDHAGQAVKGLGKEDFVLKQDGKEQAIRYFSEDPELPLTLALLVDTSGSQRTFIADETKASEVFFRAMLVRPADRAMLVQFDTSVLQLQKMTASVEDLESSLGFLGDQHGPAPGNRYGGTLLYDAVFATARGVLGKQAGRRAMVLLTDGGDNGSRISQEEAIAEAQRGDIVIYSVYYSAEDGFSGFGERGRIVLDRLSGATGGRVFEVSRKMPLEKIYGEIAEDMRLQYQIGYAAPVSAPGAYHRIELKVKDKKLKVQARTGFYAPK